MSQKRICPQGIPQHIIQRGNNKQNCFITVEDKKAYLYWLKVYSKKYKTEVHAWVLMDNHVHLLCTPQSESSISKMMQTLGRMYVQNFNYKHQRTGTLWEGRYKSSLIDSARYLLAVYRYIELNPVRAGIVKNPFDYTWSSFSHNAYGTTSNICIPHSEYLALGSNKELRQKKYLQLFEDNISPKCLNEIRISINKNQLLGGTEFIERINKLI